MKTVIYLCLVSLVLGLTTQIGLAQSSYWKTDFKRGSQQITLSYSYSQGYLVSNRSVVKLQAGYYLTNGFLVGVVGSLGREWVGDAHSEGQLSVGPVVRYQFTSSRLSPFAELAYQVGKPTPAIKQAIFFTPGINFSLLPHVRLEASYGFVALPSNERRIGQPQIGATILLGTNR